VCGCVTSKQVLNTAQITAKDYIYEKIFFGTHNIEFEIHLENSGSSAELIEKLIYKNRNMDEYAAYLEERFTEQYSADDYPLLMNDDGTQYIYHSSLIENYSIEFCDGKFIIIYYNTWYYRSGAAHGNYLFEYYIIDAAERKLLEINELITPIPDSVLKEIIADKYETELFLRDNIWPPDSISVKPEGVELLWNVYTITPYAAGHVSIEIPCSAADLYLTEKGKLISAGRAVR